MKKNQIIILVLLSAILLILTGIINLVFFQKEEKMSVILEEGIPAGAEEKFYSYLELDSRSGKFLKFDEDKLEITILYFDTETTKINQATFEIDKDTIFSKISFEPDQPNLFPEKDLKKVEQETWTTIFYLLPEKKDEIPLARLVQAETSF